MTGDAWARVKALFHGALERPAADRERWLREAAGSDPDLLREAWALLDAHDTAGDFLLEPVSVAVHELADPALGTRIGPYRILDELGRGGMGVVYLAEDERLGRRVALKSLPAVMAEDPALRERLKREARAAATITHPAVAVVYSLDEIDERLFIATEYVRGRTLRAEIDRGPLGEPRAIAIAVEICRGLAAAHAAGVVHRDLKPENVLITDEGSVKVVDFGIAHVDGVEATRLTHTGALLGTPAYMAPEQLIGGAVDGRTDLYALGLVLAEMATGRHPLQGGSAAPLSPAVAEVVSRALQTSPSARYGSAGALLAALTALAGSPAPARTGARWWWEFHQIVTAVIYGGMTVAAWGARTTIGGVAGRTVFVLALTAAVVAAVLRLHLSFTSRFYPDELMDQRRTVGWWVRGADCLFALTLIAGGLLVGDQNPGLAVLLFAVGVGAGLACLVIEPTTARAAFKTTLPRH